MKSRVLVLGLVLAGLAGRAEAASSPVHFGMEGGLTLSTLNLDATLDTLSSRIGFTAGLFLQVDISKSFSVEVEVVYTQKGNRIEFGGGGPSGISTFDLDYVEVPLLLKYYFPIPGIRPNVFLGGGVGFSVLDQLVTEGGATFGTSLDNLDVGLIGGVGVDIENLFINVRYELGLSDINTSPASSVQNGTLTLMTGYSFI